MVLSEAVSGPTVSGDFSVMAFFGGVRGTIFFVGIQGAFVLTNVSGTMVSMVASRGSGAVSWTTISEGFSGMTFSGLT